LYHHSFFGPLTPQFQWPNAVFKTQQSEGFCPHTHKSNIYITSVYTLLVSQYTLPLDLVGKALCHKCCILCSKFYIPHLNLYTQHKTKIYDCTNYQHRKTTRQRNSWLYSIMHRIIRLTGYWTIRLTVYRV